MQLRKLWLALWGALLIAVPLVGMPTGVSTAQDQAVVSLTPGEVGVAETVTLEARLQCPGGGCSAFRVALSFDRTLIRIEKAAIGPYLGDGAFEAENTVDNAAGTVVLVGSATGTPSADPAGVLFTLDVYGLVPGSAAITLDEVQIVSANGIPLTASGEGAAVTVHETGKLPFFSPPDNAWEVAFVSDRDGNPEIYAVDAAGRSPRRLTENDVPDGGPTWSPDGSLIAFYSARDGNFEIYTIGPNGENPTRLTDNPAADTDPAWSPDGSQIAFVSDRDGNAEIYVMNADGSRPTRLTNDPGLDTYPAWSPDGRQIAFTSTRGGTTEITLMNADGSGVQTLTNLFGANGWYAAWKPDGTLLAFDVERDGQADLYTLTRQGQNPTRLTPKSDYLTSSDWSPDGAYLAYMGGPDGNPDLLVMDVASQYVYRLTDDPASDTDPDWRPVYEAAPCMVSTPTANVEVRVGPGYNRGVFTYLPTNQPFSVIGQASDSEGNLWYELDKTQMQGGEAVNSLWVLSTDVQSTGACAMVPAAEAPPLILGTPVPQITPGGWQGCDSCQTCGHPGQCVTSPTGECLWDPKTCGGPPPSTDGCLQLGMQVDPSGAGSIAIVRGKPDCPDGGYSPGSVVTLQAGPNTGHRFLNWSGCGAGGSATVVTIAMNSSCTIVAHFTP